MSSTYVHYGTPSSLPSDYAVLAQYAAARSNANQEPDEDNDHDNETGETQTLLAQQSRRTSFPGGYLRPPKMSLGSAPEGILPNAVNETSPLIPRIPEEVDEAEVNVSQPVPVHALAEEIKILAKYTLPVFGTHALEYSLVIASVVSIGHLSTTALAASTLGSMTASVTGLSIIQGFTSTLDTMLPGAWTGRQPNLVGLWSQRMAVVMAATLIPILVIWFNAESILLALKQDSDVARLAALYLKYLSLGLPAYAFNCISRRYFQSQGLFAVPTRIIIVVAPINALLNWLLVWGPKPVRLGFIGAPIASAISFNLISLASIIYGAFFVPHTAWHPLSMRMFANLGILVQLGLAGVGQVASEWWSWELVGREFLGPSVLATQSVLLVSASSTYQIPFSLSVATSVRIGNLLGEQNGKRASVVAKAALILSLIFGAFNSALFMVFRRNWGRLFNDDLEVITMVASILPLVALFQVFDGLSAVTAGILRAQGKQFTGAMLNLSAYYIIGIPFGIWLSFRKDMGLEGLWIGLTVSLIYASVFGVWLCLRTDWAKEVQKVQKRVEEDHKHGQEHAAGVHAHV
ncbi:MATE efflux family protein [Punctularia strigosozonata HHB-11173 SS5]|uniref:MATE efflux family protein n=1 Tax=Punctularia strigosozonata (strain HHB-11173) TaxID=741275 RepID=UPI00044182CA|nr:MATE efflux family protein [Punctularia strigosozonata HHB-11173 SS5]EIN09142.1 MATE efflux family protein [Punctularia strigosozonata HHB-11173 SS5]